MNLAEQMAADAGPISSVQPTQSLADRMAADVASSPDTAVAQPTGPAVTPAESLGKGFMDTINGGARILTHMLPDSVVNAGNKLNNVIADKTGLVAPIPDSGFDQMLSDRESQYDAARTAAGQTGIDWWRLAGNAVQPANYIGAGGAAGATVLGRVGQSALQGGVLGAAQGAAQSTAPGQMWWDTAKGATLGAGTGGIISGAVEAIAPALTWAMNKIRPLIASGDAPSSAGADTVINNALKASNVDPASVDMSMLKGMRQDVQSALDNGSDVSPQSIVNRARAESLPVPVQLLRGQATGDPMLFSREQNLRGIDGVGEPITSRLQQQNAAFVGNLDALGAKNAMDPVSFGSQFAGKIQSTWDALQQRKNDLYDAVKNNAGQSAAMDGITAASNIKAALDTPQASHAYDLLPSNIQRTIDDLGSGELPFTVAQMQGLDKMWGDAARGADGSTAYAINTARRIIGEAPVTDETGDAAKQAYFAARQAHAQQMSLIDPKLPNGMPNQNYQPLVKSVVMDGAPPEKLFASNFLNAPPSVAAKNMQFLSTIDPNAPQTVGTTLVGEIKRQALNSASDDRGTVSEAVLRGWANDPVKSARLDALMPQPAVNTFHNLAATVEAAKKQPVASAVNSSNTGSALLNAGISMAKNSTLAQIGQRLPLMNTVVQGMNAAKTQSAVQSALNPGVTVKSLMQATPVQAQNRKLLSNILTPAAVAGEQSAQGPQD